MLDCVSNSGGRAACAKVLHMRLPVVGQVGGHGRQACTCTCSPELLAFRSRGIGLPGGGIGTLCNNRQASRPPLGGWSAAAKGGCPAGCRRAPGARYSYPSGLCRRRQHAGAGHSVGVGGTSGGQTERSEARQARVPAVVTHTVYGNS